MIQINKIFLLGLIVLFGAYLLISRENQTVNLQQVLLFQKLKEEQKVCLVYDGIKTAYETIDKYFGEGNYEVPDTLHPQFGPHIKFNEQGDLEFNIHLNSEGDIVTQKTDRQRNELKISSKSPSALQGYENDIFKYTWSFKVDTNFQSSSKFTHLFQIKSDLSDADPFLTLGIVSNKMKIFSLGAYIYSTPSEIKTYFGQWFNVEVTVNYNLIGSFIFKVTTENGTELINYQQSDVSMFAGTLMRPKWGIYRSVAYPSALRDETVLFRNICIQRLTN